MFYRPRPDPLPEGEGIFRGSLNLAPLIEDTATGQHTVPPVAGKTTGDAIYPRIPLRSIRATYPGLSRSRHQVSAILIRAFIITAPEHPSVRSIAK